MLLPSGCPTCVVNWHLLFNFKHVWYLSFPNPKASCQIVVSLVVCVLMFLFCVCVWPGLEIIWSFITAWAAEAKDYPSPPFHSQGWHSRCLYDLMFLSAGFSVCFCALACVWLRGHIRIFLPFLFICLPVRLAILLLWQRLRVKGPPKSGLHKHTEEVLLLRARLISISTEPGDFNARVKRVKHVCCFFHISMFKYALCPVYLLCTAMSSCSPLSIGKHKRPPLLLAASGCDLRIVGTLAYFASLVCEWVLTVTGLPHSSTKGQPSDGIEQR